MARPFAANRKEIDELLELAKRDIELADIVKEQDLDWAGIIAYNSMLQSGRALMFFRGMRPAGESHHMAVVSFLEHELGDPEHDIVISMARIRKKRNIALYTRLGNVSLRELEETLQHARALLRVAMHIIGAANSDLADKRR